MPDLVDRRLYEARIIRSLAPLFVEQYKRAMRDPNHIPWDQFAIEVRHNMSHELAGIFLTAGLGMSRELEIARAPGAIYGRSRTWADEQATKLADDVVKKSRELVEQAIKEANDRNSLAAMLVLIFASELRLANIAATECLPADTQVDGARATAAFRRWYEGPMVQIVTKRGYKLTGTPNHPVLTLRGWIGLGEITETDNFVCYKRGIENFRIPGNENIEHPPSTIGQIFDSLAAISVACRVRTGKPDFHGDGTESNVDVFRPNHMLPIGRFSEINERLVDGILAPADARKVLLAAKSAPFPRGPGILGISKSHGFAKRSLLDSSLFQCVSHNSSSKSDFFANVRKGHAGFVHGNELGITSDEDSLWRNPSSFYEKLPRLRSSPDVNSSSFAHFSHSSRMASDDFTNLASSQTGKIETDSLRSLIRIDHIATHVFNLTTVDGYFQANGFYTGNTTRAISSGESFTASLHNQSLPQIAEETGRSQSELKAEVRAKLKATAEEAEESENELEATGLGQIGDATYKTKKKDGRTLVAVWNVEHDESGLPDSRVCPICRPLDGHSEIVWSATYPGGPPGHIR